MKKSYFLILIGVIIVNFLFIFKDTNEKFTTYTPTYASNVIDSLENVQCPIPFSDRVPNRTNIQCVWASIEMLGRWAEEPKLINPPLTSRNECKSYASPKTAAVMLNKLNVKFEQSYNNRSLGIKLIKKAMQEKRGCLWGVPQHAMVLVHYDESANVVKWVDNSDSNLAVQTTDIEGFNKRWDSWVIIIYADKDIISSKTSIAQNIPIIDMNNKQRQYNKDYIVFPDNAIEINP